MNKKLLFMLAFFVFALAIFVSAQPCNPNSDTSACGFLISNLGHGAVELCKNCFVCGAEDGVCPAWYSTGVQSSDPFEVLLRKGTVDRPEGGGAADSIAYAFGNVACNYFGGTFSEAKTKQSFNDEWETSGILGFDNMDSRDDYVKAVCLNVSARPSCDVCVDPDCHTVLKGMVYVPGTDGFSPFPVYNASITVLPRFNETAVGLNRSAKSNPDGSFVVPDAYSGEVNVYCTAEGYEYISREITLKPGINIVDCPLRHGTCDANCTVPSAQYGVRVCDRDCQDVNGCDFNQSEYIPDDLMGIDMYDLMDACHGRPQGFFYELNVTVDKDSGKVNVTGVECCNEYPFIKIYSLFSLGDDVTNLLTRRFNKLLPDGSPIFLNILVFNK